MSGYSVIPVLLGAQIGILLFSVPAKELAEHDAGREATLPFGERSFVPNGRWLLTTGFRSARGWPASRRGFRRAGDVPWSAGAERRNSGDEVMHMLGLEVFLKRGGVDVDLSCHRG
jgi:hypothetical protein